LYRARHHGCPLHCCCGPAQVSQATHLHAALFSPNSFLYKLSLAFMSLSAAAAEGSGLGCSKTKPKILWVQAKAATRNTMEPTGSWCSCYKSWPP
jgi:hypothetical protein